VSVSCTVAQRSYAAPWEVWTSETVEHPGLRSEPFVLTFAERLLENAECKVQAPGGSPILAEVVRFDPRLDFVALRVNDKAFWKDSVGAVQRAGVLPLGARATAVTAVGTQRAVDAQITAFLPTGSPAGMRIVAALSPGPGWQGFLFDDYGRLAGFVNGEAATPEWTIGPWPQVAATPTLGLSVVRAENQAFQKRYGVPESNGVLVKGAAPMWQDLAAPGVALVAIDGQEVGHDSTVHVSALNVRLPANYVPLALPGGFNATVQLGDATKSGMVKFGVDKSEDPPPSFLMLGGLVFAPLSNPLIDELSGGWLLQLPNAIGGSVVLANKLPHAVNAFLPTDTVRGIHSCNGKEVASLADMLKLVHSGEDYLACSFVATSESDRRVGVYGDEPAVLPDFVLDLKELKEKQEEVLEQYHVPVSMSMDLCGEGALDQRTLAACKAHATEKEQHSLLRGARAFLKGGSWPDNAAGRVAWGGHEHGKREQLLSGEKRTETDAFGPADESAVAALKRQTGTQPENFNPVPPQPAAGMAARKSGPVPLNHVVKILTSASDRDFLVPWRMTGASSMTGSGVMVSGREFGMDKDDHLVLTNAHVVKGAQNVLIQRQDLPQKVRAEVITIAPDSDMAVLRVKDTELWKDVGPLKVNRKVPAAHSVVRVAGYPLGGIAVSITDGVVSRVIGMEYEFNQPASVNAPGKVVAMQVDAAINPGNSGGPVFDEEGAFIGLAFAGMRGADNMGFVIPAQVVEARLPSLLAEGRPGISEMGLSWRAVENPAMRRYLGLGDAGVLVQSCAPLGPLAEKLAPGDVLLAVDGYTVAPDGTVLVPGSTDTADMRLPLDALVVKPAGAETVLRVRKAKTAVETEEKVVRKEKAEEKAEEKTEEKSEEKTEEKAEEKTVEKAEEKTEEKTEEKAEEKTEEKSEEKTEEKAMSVVRKAQPAPRRLRAMGKHPNSPFVKHPSVESFAQEDPSTDIRVAFKPIAPRVPRYDTVPSYVVVGGLVFTKFTVPLYNAFSAVGPRKFDQSVPSETEQTLDTWKRDPDEDIVVLLDGLSAPVNEFYEFPRMSMLHSLNGEPVKSLAQLIELLPKAFEAEFLEFSFEASGFSALVLDAKLAADDTELLSAYAVPAPASDDLLAAWCEHNKAAGFSRWSCP